MNYFHEIPYELQELHKTFVHHGRQLYLVGGAVRNIVLGIQPKDWDCATNASPQEVMGMFRRVIPTGLEHGTVTILHRGIHYEVTTFRLDGEYTDARRPDSVTYTNDIVEDLSRRDFTMNAMAIDLGDGSLLDPFKGQDDLKKGIIRTVGAPSQRFAEDGLRIARALRFAAQLGFRIHEETWDAIEERLPKLALVSVERFRDEFIKTLGARHSVLGIRYFQESKALGSFLPDLAIAGTLFPFGEEGPSALDFACDIARNIVSKDTALLLAALCIRIQNKVFSVESFRGHFGNLKLSNKILEDAEAVLGNLLPLPQDGDSHTIIRRRIAKIGREREEKLRSMHVAIQVSWKHLSGEILFDPGLLEEKTRVVLGQNPPLTLRELALNGNDLRQITGKPGGPWMGEVLESMLEMVLDKPECNTREALEVFLRDLYPSGSA